jgi:hypothetical protein
LLPSTLKGDREAQDGFDEHDQFVPGIRGRGSEEREREKSEKVLGLGAVPAETGQAVFNRFSSIWPEATTAREATGLIYNAIDQKKSTEIEADLVLRG